MAASAVMVTIIKVADVKMDQDCTYTPPRLFLDIEALAITPDTVFDTSLEPR